jgi:alpha-beta hydrolase superfamily lysophospholipase
MTNGGRGGAKIWRQGFMWGVLNRVPARRREEIYADALFEAAPVWRALSNPAAAPNGAGKVDSAEVKAPVLTIAAGRDRAVPAAWARGVAALYAGGGGRLMEYPDNGHWIIDEPGSDAVAADVDAWLQAVLA